MIMIQRPLLNHSTSSCSSRKYPDSPSVGEVWIIFGTTHRLKKTRGWNIVIYTPIDYTIIGVMLNPYPILHGLMVWLYRNTEESLTKHSQPFMIWWNSIPILLTTLSLTFHLWSSENQDCRVQKQKRKDKPITMHIHMLCDWFSSSASASDFDNLVFTRSWVERKWQRHKQNWNAVFTRS